MKTTGYKSDYAAGVEASASTGGTLLPPIMGAVAFLMAEWLGVPYTHIAIIAFIPAVLLYYVMFLQVHFEAKKLNILSIPRSEIPPLRETLRKTPPFLIPVVVLLVLMFIFGFSPYASALWAALTILITTAFNKNSRVTLTKLGNIFSESANSSIIPGLACAMAGILMGSVAMTGIAASFTNSLVNFAEGRLFLLLLVAAAASFLFGMGVGSIPSYVFVAVLVAPALVEIGQPLIASHLFVFWIAMSAFITPPVCISAYVAAAIANAPPMRSGFQAIRLGIGMVLIPFAFIYNPGLILNDSITGIIVAIISIALGLLGIAIAFEGYLSRSLQWWERLLFMASGLIMFIPTYWIKLMSFGVMAMLFIWQYKNIIGLRFSVKKTRE